ncbi:hypothetical protein HNP29_000456 [Pseudomonas alcaligenes]|nr:hypothetical protein [Pseudomonas alcaligenes]
MAEPDVSFLEKQIELLKGQRDRIQDTTGYGGGQPPGGSHLEKRVEDLEKSNREIKDILYRIELKIDSLDKNIATKADVVVLASKDDVTKFATASSKDIQDMGVSLRKEVNDLSSSLQSKISDQSWRYLTVAVSLATLAFLAARFVKI